MATYYIANAGDDIRGDGSINDPWQTISKVNSLALVEGDVVCFNKGDIWRETLIVPDSGVVGNYIEFTSYGIGNNPKFLGSDVSTGWSNYSGNVWVSDSVFTNPRATWNCDLFFNNLGTITWGLYKSSIGNLTSEYDWTWSGNHIYIYAATDPDSRYTTVEIPQRNVVINLNDKNYLHFNGIDLSYSIFAGYQYKTYPMLSQNGLIIENSDIGYIGGNITSSGNEVGYGIDASYSDMIIRNNEIHNCGRRGHSMNIYGGHDVQWTMSNVLIEDNYFHDGYHTTGLDFSIGSSNGWYRSCVDGVIIRGNKFYDAPTTSAYSAHIFMQNQKKSDAELFIRNISIYANVFISHSAASVQIEACDDILIYNNTFYNCNTVRTALTPHVWVSGGTDNIGSEGIKVKNNIFYTDLNFDTNGAGVGVFCTTSYGQDYNEVDADYNLYYRINNALRIIIANATGFYMNSSFPLATVGWETNGLKNNPLFTDAGNEDFSLQISSPAINSGVYLGGVVDRDFEGNSFNNPPSIGAYESGPAPTTTVAPTTTAAPTTAVPTTTTTTTTTEAPLALIEAPWGLNRFILNTMLQNLYNRIS